jgi:hypothetical protein
MERSRPCIGANSSRGIASNQAGASSDRMIGRYWLILAAGRPYAPSQWFYHVPADWLRAVNEVMIVEEQQASPGESCPAGAELERLLWGWLGETEHGSG